MKMKSISSLSAILLPAFLDANPMKYEWDSKIKREPAIVNGKEVHGSEFPYMVSFRAVYPNYVFKENHAVTFYNRFCGGTCIDTDPITILTAAHCLMQFHGNDDGLQFDDKEVELYADFGRTKGVYYGNTYDESNDEFITVQVTKPSQISCHQSFSANGDVSLADIAVIIINDTAEVAKFPSNYQVAKIPDYKPMSEGCCADNEILYAIGYGLDDDEEQGGKPTKTLEKISMEYHPRHECLNLIWTYDDNQLPVPENAQFFEDTNLLVCAKGTDQDTCQGDSGGPIFRVIDDGTVEVVGIASYVLGDGLDHCNSDHPIDGMNVPSFFTSTAHYADWINEVIEKGGIGMSKQSNAGNLLFHGVWYFITLLFVLVV